MKRLRWTATLAAVALLAGACMSNEGPGATGPNGEVTLDFWAFEEGGTRATMETLVADFEAAHPKINIEVTTYPEESYSVKIDTSLAAGRAPDLALVFGPDYMRRGLLLPLDDMVAENDIDLSTFSQAIVKGPSEFSCAWEGTLYCLGSNQGAVMMFYNKDMFDEAGIPYPEPWPAMTTDELVDIACQMSDPENQVWGAAYPDPMTMVPWEVVVSEDGRTAEGYVNSSESVQMHETLARGITEKCAPSLNVLDPFEQGADFFSRGQLAMVVTDFQGLRKIENAGINYGVTTNPTPSEVEPYFFVWTDGVGVFKNSEYPDEAKEFIAFLATEGQRIRAETTGDVPLDTKVAKEIGWAGGIPGRRDGLEVLTHARPPVFIPNIWEVYGPIWDAWELILGGEKTAQAALDDAAPAIQENLDKAWETWEEEEG